MQERAGAARDAEALLKPKLGRYRSGKWVAKAAWRARAALVGGFIILGMVCSVVLGPLLLPTSPVAVDLADSFRPPGWVAGGSATHPLGTDHLGRDILSRLWHGGRISMLIGVLAVAVAGSLGLSLGLVSGYFGGSIDGLIMRLADVQQSLPFVALAIMVVAVLGPSTRNVVLTLGIGGWVLFARIARGEVLRVRETVYVEAAIAIGAGHLRILVRHILPNIASPCIVTASFAFSVMVIVEASLSFLGLGVPPPIPSWGNMLYDARNYMETAWWLPMFPGLAIMLAVLGINLVGDWLRDVLDPRMRGRGP